MKIEGRETGSCLHWREDWIILGLAAYRHQDFGCNWCDWLHWWRSGRGFENGRRGLWFGGRRFLNWGWWRRGFNNVPRCSRSWFLDVGMLWMRRGRWRRRRGWYRDWRLLNRALRFFYNGRATRGGGRERREHLPGGERRLRGENDLRKRRQKQTGNV